MVLRDINMWDSDLKKANCKSLISSQFITSVYKSGSNPSQVFQYYLRQSESSIQHLHEKLMVVNHIW